MTDGDADGDSRHGHDAWVIAARGTAIVAAALSVAASVAAFIFWGAAYGFILTTLFLWLFVVPLWAASRFLGATGFYRPTPERAAWIVAAFLVLFLWVGVISGRLAELGSLGVVPTIVTGLAAVVVVGLPVALFVMSTVRNVPVQESGVIDEMPARGVWLAVVGVVIGFGGLASFLALVFFSDPYSMTNGRAGFTRATAASQWLAGPAAALVVPFLPAWGFGLAQAGLVVSGYARARARRRASVERTLARLDDHYALHRVGQDTHQHLRALLLDEREGRVPGERPYIEARAATVRFAGLGILMIVAVLVAAGLVTSTSEWNPEAANARTPDVEYWPCSDCTNDADWNAFLDQVRDWKVSTTLMLTTAFATGIAMLLVVPRLAGDRRAARGLLKRHVAEREQLERRMLEEVRAATRAA